MKTVKGDLIDLAQQGKFDVIAHGCNCMCEMGAGIAKQIKTQFPAAYDADQQTTVGDASKLGTCTAAACQIDDGTVDVINAYTQYDYRGKGVLVDYDAVRSCLKWIKSNYSGKRIGLPKIGAGMAGGDWNRIHDIIVEELAGEDATIVKFKP